MKERIEWMDFLRGVCIILVIQLHTLLLSGWLRSGGFLDIESYILSPYRMQILFFLSGLVASKSINKNNIDYFKGKFNNILYPYLVWSLPYLLVMHGDYFYNSEYHEIVKSVVGVFVGISDLTWFLYFIFLFFVLAKLAFNFKVNNNVLIGVSLLLYLAFDKYDLILMYYGDYYSKFLRFNDFFYYFIFFVCGIKLGAGKVESLSKNKILVAVSVVACLIVLTIPLAMFLYKNNIVFMPLVLLSIPGIVCASRALESRLGFLSVFIRFVGRNSIYFYLTHMLILFILVNAFKGVNSSLIPGVVFVITLVIISVFLKLKDKHPILDLLFTPKMRKKVK
ncbi:acyltransferase family protein [Rouxiella sp. Mn2063]|uniref:acyltransferase family protein n=1 Tax=Rouxiella sp. Mn2063 TaxID=3395262 RepID=UPI003BC78C6E